MWGTSRVRAVTSQAQLLFEGRPGFAVEWTTNAKSSGEDRTFGGATRPCSKDSVNRWRVCEYPRSVFFGFRGRSVSGSDGAEFLSSRAHVPHNVSVWKDRNSIWTSWLTLPAGFRLKLSRGVSPRDAISNTRSATSVHVNWPHALGSPSRRFHQQTHVPRAQRENQVKYRSGPQRGSLL